MGNRKSQKSKKPKLGVDPSLNKGPKFASNPELYYDQKPSWRISKIELTDCYGWHVLDLKQIGYIKAKLSNFETMTWREILVESRKQNHLVEVSKLSADANRRLVETQQDDIDQLLSLRLTGKQRVWGVLHQGACHLLWWDPRHQVCPSLLKHT